MKTSTLERNDFLILLAGMLFSGFVAVILGKDLNWDMANYHYYNPYAFLHQRWFLDYWPASFTHVNLSPSADFISYFFINHFNAFTAIYLSGAIQGICFFLIYKIARFFLEIEQTDVPPLFPALLFAFMGMWQTLVFFSLGSFQNDLLVSIFVLGFFYFSCLWVRQYSIDKQLSLRLVALSGLLLGMGAGLKMTTASFIVGATTAYIFLPIILRDKLKILLVGGTAILFGVLLVNGYWMLNLWQRFHNPFYPFLSHLLYGDDVHAHVMGSYTPQGLMKRLFYAFYPSIDGSVSFREYQFPIIYMLLVFTAALTFFKKYFLKIEVKNNLLMWWYYSFFIFSYIVWENYFGISRYVRPLAMLSPLLIFLLLKRTLHPSFWVSFIFVFTLTFTSMSPEMGIFRYPMYKQSYFNIVMPGFVSKTPAALVLMSYPEYANYAEPRPLTYLIPFFPHAWRFIGIPLSETKETFLAPSELLKIKQLIAKNTANLYMITGDGCLSSVYKIALALGLKGSGFCETIHSDRQLISRQNTYICPLTKI
jgi:hypothetical protein